MPCETKDLWDMGPLVLPHTRGDREFDGHGLRIWINTRLRTWPQRKPWARIRTRFQENRADWKTAEGTFDLDDYDGTSEKVARITSIVDPGATSFTFHGREDGHEVFTRPEDRGPVREYSVVGDKHGNDAGTRTGVIATLNPVRIRV